MCRSLAASRLQAHLKDSMFRDHVAEQATVEAAQRRWLFHRGNDNTFLGPGPKTRQCHLKEGENGRCRQNIACTPERSKMRSAVRLDSDDASADTASDVLVIPLPAKIRDAGVNSSERNARL